MRFKAVSASAPGLQKSTEPEPAESPTAKVVQNLLVHIPGEASGFYLMGIDVVRDSSTREVSARDALVVGLMALVLLVVVRWLANATWAVMVTTIVAFLLWMSVIDHGFLRVYGLALPGKLGSAVALFYSALVTALASAGKLK
jgi:hypothetical protein